MSDFLMAVLYTSKGNIKKYKAVCFRDSLFGGSFVMMRKIGYGGDGNDKTGKTGQRLSHRSKLR